MVKDNQVRRLFMEINKGKSIIVSACNADMSDKTARKYLRLKKYPSQIKKPHVWKTRDDPFESVWNEVISLINLSSELQSKTIFEHLMDKYPDKFHMGQLRTLQRKIKHWKIENGMPKQVYFPQRHEPGILCQSDFTNMNELQITINGELFKHLLYHFVLTYSNWEYIEICDSESFENLSRGIQNALWKLGKVPLGSKTDCLSSAIKNHKGKDKEFTSKYQDLLNHYGMTGFRTQPASPNENGDVEQRHYRFKQALKQELLIRGSNDFYSIDEYKVLLENLCNKLNKVRIEKLSLELENMKPLPENRISDYKRLEVIVSRNSTIRVLNNTYSVNSSLIGTKVKVYVHSDFIEVWYGQKLMEKINRIKGSNKHSINYRHIIDWLIRKPGAFENYMYKEDLYPSTYYRIAFDILKKDRHDKGIKEYIKILYLSKYEGEAYVNDVLSYLINNNFPLSYFIVEQLLYSRKNIPSKIDIEITSPDISIYNNLLQSIIDLEISI